MREIAELSQGWRKWLALFSSRTLLFQVFHMAYSAPKKSRNGKRIIDTTELQSFLDSLNVGVQGSIHINGPSFATALVSVDFGSPLQQARLSPEETIVLNELLRDVAKDVIAPRTLPVRINHDGPNGVYWASLT